ncbi:MAG: 3-deoxy-manno-octulosonate cytidylyltransferase [Gemmatimonadetes bacterium]|nr:3-deoxy-manno-octulosonate cytidylyltransferase [Gemmatimonadota bacterium]
MSTLAVIPARLAAVRLPRKPLRLLAGRPLIVRVWERVCALGVADRVVVATDSPDVASVCREAGAEAVLTRADHPSGTDRVAEVAVQTGFSAFRTIVNVQGDEPFVSEQAVRGAVDIVATGQYPLGTAACLAPAEVLARPDVVKVVTADDGRAMYFSRASIPFLRDPADAGRLAGQVRQHIGVYAYTHSALTAWVTLKPHPLELIEKLEQLRPLAAGWAMGVAHVTDAQLGGIDTEDDLVRANAQWDSLPHTTTTGRR